MPAEGGIQSGFQVRQFAWQTGESFVIESMLERRRRVKKWDAFGFLRDDIACAVHRARQSQPAFDRAEGASPRARVPPMDYADKLPPSPWYICGRLR